MPHAYILLFLEPKDKYPTPDHTDRIISTELPDSQYDPIAYEIVRQLIIHGPCGIMNPRCSCMKNGKCSKNYPKQFRPITTIDEDGFSNYRRRDDGKTVNVGKHTLENRSIVPYNIDLLVKYQSHMNVEWCNRSCIIKYLFKYINK